jgi:ribulose 1,5-bisphosphate carboxylase large subunit-like protein
MSTDTMKQEDHTTIEAPQVEALAAAAAAAVTASATAEATATVTVVTLAHTPVQTTNGRVSLLNDEDPQGKRRFFPRVKHLISNKEWEDVSQLIVIVIGFLFFFLSLSVDLDPIIAQPI